MNPESIGQKIRKSLNFIAFPGVLLIVLGVAAIVEPRIATFIVFRALSWTLLFVGIVRTADALQYQGQRGFWSRLLIGLSYIIVGILLLGNVLGAKFTITLAFGGAVLVQGILEVITAFRTRPRAGWDWMLLMGALAMTFGIMVINGWPLNAEWLIGFLSGISFIWAGIWIIKLPEIISRHLLK